MTTIRKVASEAGVSIATVSRVINGSASVTEDARERVLEAVHRCGYVATVGRISTRLVAYLYAGESSLGSPYDSALLEGISDGLAADDLDLVILNHHRDKNSTDSFTQFFMRKGVRGVILRASAAERAVCRAIVDEKFPMILLGDHFEYPGLSYIYSDSESTSFDGVEHLVALGHRRIAFAASETEDADHIDRFNGYQRALKEHGIEVDPKLRYHIPAHRLDGAQLLRSMFSSMAPPTAVYITDPMVAVGALNEAHRIGVKIPEDLSILGFDDADLRHNVYPRMTAICQDARHIGRQAFSSLAKLLEADGAEKTVREISSTWLEINETTGAPTTKPVRILPDGKRVEFST